MNWIWMIFCWERFFISLGIPKVDHKIVHFLLEIMLPVLVNMELNDSSKVVQKSSTIFLSPSLLNPNKILMFRIFDPFIRSFQQMFMRFSHATGIIYEELQHDAFVLTGLNGEKSFASSSDWQWVKSSVQRRSSQSTSVWGRDGEQKSALSRKTRRAPNGSFCHRIKIKAAPFHQLQNLFTSFTVIDGNKKNGNITI